MENAINKEPMVTIVIPVYNGSSYMREAIDSAINQTYKNIEILVINDGSNDNGATEEIALSYGNHIRYFKKENGGVSSALNLGLRQMAGEYFCWLSHDDLYKPYKTEYQVARLNESGAKAVYCLTEIVDASGCLIHRQEAPCSRYLTGAMSYYETWMYACSIVIHKSCFDEIGEFNEQNRTTQDVEFSYLLLHNFTVDCLPEYLVARRDHGMSGTYSLRNLNRVELRVLIQRMIKQYGLEFFSSKHGALTRSERAEIYEKLGDAIRKDKENVAIYCYLKSIRELMWVTNPSVSKLLSTLQASAKKNVKSMIKHTVNSFGTM